ncbi:MAG: hypothetical protein M1391_09180 [Bacteroidetes bacterium]|nr:hypothetical protein [Bacteroidota bacterium]
MKKLLSILLLFVLTIPLVAQEGDEVGWVGRFGAAGGVAPIFVFPNIDQINTQVEKMGIGKLSSSGTFAIGGSGYIYIMLVDNLRIGGIGFSGSKSSSGSVGGLNKEVKYNYGLGGITVEYSLPFIKSIAVSVGAILGAGSSSVEIYQNSGNFTWNNVWGKVNSGGVMTNLFKVSDKITNSFFTIAPTLNVDIPISRFVAFRIGGGYITTIGSSWKINNDQTISNVPSDLTSNSFFIQTGIYFGLFAF